jgi:hypothetical protein
VEHVARVFLLHPPHASRVCYVIGRNRIVGHAARVFLLHPQHASRVCYVTGRNQIVEHAARVFLLHHTRAACPTMNSQPLNSAPAIAIHAFSRASAHR